jgi:hypothetical protein
VGGISGPAEYLKTGSCACEPKPQRKATSWLAKVCCTAAWLPGSSPCQCGSSFGKFERLLKVSSTTGAPVSSASSRSSGQALA